jgi:predicted ribosome-associated RNA-binding protein Tma20
MYLKKGAKLMWPGVKKIKNDAKKDEIFAIKMGENIIGVGVFLGDIENREGPCLACL